MSACGVSEPRSVVVVNRPNPVVTVSDRSGGDCWDDGSGIVDALTVLKDVLELSDFGVKNTLNATV